MLSSAEIQAIAGDLMGQHERREQFIAFPERVPTMDDAVKVQDTYVSLLTEKFKTNVAGYKIALTSKSTRDWLKIDEPCIGQVLGNRIHQSPHTLSVSDYVRFSMETEICVILDRDLKDECSIEAVQAHVSLPRGEARARARDALGMVGIPSPEERLHAYPHQFSGGMRQRVAIAIALLHNPDVLIADEPTTALDVTIQAQILSEVQRLAAEHGTALIWISHDLSVIAGLADRIAVMYAGRVVETGDAADVLDHPLHPYTAGLIGSVPSRNKRGQMLRQIPGMTPSLLSLPAGCAFRSRCERAAAACEQAPSERGAGHSVRCFHPLPEIDQ